MNNKDYKFYCIDNSFNENELLYESKGLIIKFDIPMYIDLKSMYFDDSIYKDFFEDYNRGKAIFTIEKQLFLYFESKNYFCEFYSENYELILRVNNSKVILTYDELRDNETNTSGITSAILKDGNFLPIYIAAGIYNNSIELSVYSEAHDVAKNIGTSAGIKFVTKKLSGSFSIDPITKKMIEKYTVCEKIEYATPDELVMNVQNIISSLNNILFTYGGYNAFWDNNKSIKTPKKEVDSHDSITLMLVDKLTKAGLNLHKEDFTSSGNVDFYISGYVKDYGILGVCIEVKNAHSDKLKDGFFKQLPEYVKRKNALYGIYLILYFNSDKYAVYEEYENFHEPADVLNALRMTFKYEHLVKNIFAYSLDVSKPIQASRL